MSRSTVTPAPPSAETLARLGAEARRMLEGQSLEPFEAEETFEFTPTFDAPIDPRVVAAGPTSP